MCPRLAPTLRKTGMDYICDGCLHFAKAAKLKITGCSEPITVNSVSTVSQFTGVSRFTETAKGETVKARVIETLHEGETKAPQWCPFL